MRDTTRYEISHDEVRYEIEDTKKYDIPQSKRIPRDTRYHGGSRHAKKYEIRGIKKCGIRYIRSNMMRCHSNETGS